MPSKSAFLAVPKISGSVNGPPKTSFVFPLQIGLAVGDINTVQRNANLRRLAMQVAFNAEVERKFPKFITRMVYKPVLVVKPNIIKHRLQ